MDKTVHMWSQGQLELAKNANWPGWETVRLIGRGNFGAVYEIRRDFYGSVENAALKVISIPQNESDLEEMYCEGHDNESITETFQEHMQSIVGEYALMRQMADCHHIVRSEDIRCIQHDNGIGWDIYIKMELLTPLMKSLPEKIPEQMVRKLAMDICDALVTCKQCDVIHRDIKPQNIFVAKNGDYKLGDFGIAKTVEKTMGGTLAGTFKFMAPEVFFYKPYGHSADIYSLGLVLYWMLNERRMPFLPLPPARIDFSMDEKAKQRRLAGEKLPPPAHGSQALKQIVMKACAYEPKDRYASASEMLRDLKGLTGETVLIREQNHQADDLAEDRTILLTKTETLRDQTATTVSLGTQPERRKKRILPWILGAAVVVALVAGLLLPGVLKGKPEAEPQQTLENPKVGWQSANGNIYYYGQNGQMLVSCLSTIDGEIYAFGADGVMQTGWYDDSGNLYYLQPNGQAARGWYEEHYFDDVGRMLTGQNEIDGKTYLFDEDGVCRIVITVHPVDCTVPMGEKAKVFLEAEGEELTYTWWASDVGDTDYYQSKTIFGTSYNIKVDEVRNGRKVYCVITDRYGNTLQSKTATIKAE